MGARSFTSYLCTLSSVVVIFGGYIFSLQVHATPEKVPSPTEPHIVSIADKRPVHNLRNLKLVTKAFAPMGLIQPDNGKIEIHSPTVAVQRLDITGYNLSQLKSVRRDSASSNTSQLDDDSYKARIKAESQTYSTSVPVEKILEELEIVFEKDEDLWHPGLIKELFPEVYTYILQSEDTISLLHPQTDQPENPPEPDDYLRKKAQGVLALHYLQAENAPSWLTHFQSWFDHCTLLWQLAEDEDQQFQHFQPYQMMGIKPGAIPVSELDEPVTEKEVHDLFEWINSQPFILRQMSKALSPPLMNILKLWLFTIADQFTYSSEWRKALLGEQFEDNPEDIENMEFIVNAMGQYLTEGEQEHEQVNEKEEDQQKDELVNEKVAKEGWYKFVRHTLPHGPVFNRRRRLYPNDLATPPLPTVPSGVTQIHKRNKEEWKLDFSRLDGVHFYSYIGDREGDEKSPSHGCGYCDYNRNKKSFIVTHMARHHFEQKEFVCDHPGCINPQTKQPWEFCRNDELTRHKKKHMLAQGEHVCSECDKSFYRADHLRKHQKTHTKATTRKAKDQRPSSIDSYGILTPEDTTRLIEDARRSNDVQLITTPQTSIFMTGWNYPNLKIEQISMKK